MFEQNDKTLVRLTDREIIFASNKCKFEQKIEKY